MFRYFIRNIQFSAIELTHNIFKTLFSSFGILFLIAFLVVYLSLKDAARGYLAKNVFGKMNINEIIILPKKGKRSISIYAVKKIRKMKELKNTETIIKLDYSTKVHVEMFGKSKQPFSPIYGVSRKYLRKEVRKWRRFRYRKGKPVPVVAPSYVLDMYNSFASVNGLPRMNLAMLNEFPFRILVKVGLPFSGSERFIQHNSYLLGMSTSMNKPGIYVPKSYVTSFARKYAMETGKYRKGYSYVRIKTAIKDVAKLPTITRRIRRLGVTVQSQSDVSKKTNKALIVLDGLSYFIGGVMLLLTVISIFNSYMVVVYNRNYSFSLKRILGISKIRIILTFVIEASIIGAIYGILGFFGGKYLTVYISTNIGHWIPALGGVKLMPISNSFLSVAIIISIIISSLSAFIPSLFAAGKNLFHTVNN